MSDENKQKPVSSGSGGSDGYRVQVRVAHVSPTRPVRYFDAGFNVERILTTEWVSITFPVGNNPAGVPVTRRPGLIDMARYGLLERDAAVALAYTFAAQHGDSCHIRLQKHRLEYTYKETLEGDPEELSQHLDSFQLMLRSKPEQS